MKKGQVYLTTREFFIVKANGDHTPVPVGTILTARKFAELTPQKQNKCRVFDSKLDALIYVAQHH